MCIVFTIKNQIHTLEMGFKKLKNKTSYAEYHDREMIIINTLRIS